MKTKNVQSDIWENLLWKKTNYITKKSQECQWKIPLGLKIIHKWDFHEIQQRMALFLWVRYLSTLVSKKKDKKKIKRKPIGYCLGAMLVKQVL